MGQTKELFNRVYFPNTDWTDYAIDLSQEYFQKPEDRELGAFVGYLQATLPLIGYLPSRFYTIPQIGYESLSARDVPTQLRRPSYERQERRERIAWLYWVWYGGALFACASFLLFLQLKKMGWLI